MMMVICELSTRTITLPAQTTRLSCRAPEFLILSRLARTPERVVSAEELWEYAWGSSKRLNTESLHVYIYRLRNKLGIYDLKIDTMVNVGYRLLLASRTKTQS